ncbi:short-subunit dehydrogenase involved in D-alanine esterification of teichoic acids [Cerasibacillus quisquiliarum]|uniref:Short-chain dehydrogenase n=1 Tax=Cerasibacillus quisquiliarum TaxID=227865 RepID=A0A511UUE3_9BACI|nr:hypothetical protein [Cerasibacillus quisquiliarum]MBB5144901.1 short-subunit dehydrogenase involved in D-alanine esterification of teichoic acids [Cerasibacillus quisquiliarum]GEN30207.1 hypothetical protein CQU01_04450 [Cerasibacillus quisquiliarum]
MKHVLIIGGTGMLREMSSWVIKQANKTMLIGRNKEKLEQTVPSGYEHKVHYQFIDYRDTLKLQEGIQHALEVHGAFDYVIAWIHSSAQLEIRLNVLSITGGIFRYIFWK